MHKDVIVNIKNYIFNEKNIAIKINNVAKFATIEV